MLREENQKRRTFWSGMLLILGAAVLWSLNGALIKLIYQKGVGPSGLSIAFYRSLFAGLFLLPMARRTLGTLRSRRLPSPGGGGGQSPVSRMLGGLAAMVTVVRPAAICCLVFYTLMTVCFVVANTKTEAANAIILQYTSTFWIFGLSPWLLKEKPQSGELWLLALALAGITIIFWGNAATDLVGLATALSSGLFFGLLTLMLRKMKDSDPAAVTVFNNLGSALLLLPFVFVSGGLAISTRSLALLVFMGVVQFGLPYYLYTRGLARVRASQGALASMAEAVLVPVWAFLAVGEVIPPFTAIGGSVVLVALALFLFRR